jgi:hypothetical protein
MAYKFTENSLGWQPISETSTVQNHPLRTVRRATDPTYGEGEFIYLQGIGSTVVGSVVNYSGSGATALASIALDEPDPLAVAMSANVANQFGWYQIGGLALADKAINLSLAAGARVGATAGHVVAAATGLQMQGAVAAAVSTSSGALGTLALVMISRPIGPSDLS